MYEAAEKNHAEIHAYVLMTNHVHLLVTPVNEFTISHMMQDLGRKYVRSFNLRYGRSGTLWEGRYKASLVDSEAYLLTCMRYIEMNPVRAAIVESPGEYRWSSYAGNALGKADRLLKHHLLYLSLGSDESTRRRVYRGLFRPQLVDQEVHAIRDALNHELVLGRESFKDEISATTDRQTRPGAPGRPSVK